MEVNLLISFALLPRNFRRVTLCFGVCTSYELHRFHLPFWASPRLGKRRSGSADTIIGNIDSSNQ